MRRPRFVVLLEWAQGLSSLGLVVAGVVHLAQVGFRDAATYLVMFAGLALGFWSLLGRRSRIIEERAQAVPSPSPKDKESHRTDLLLKTRDLLPEEPPAGWSRPRAPRGERYWVVDAGNETLRVELHRQGRSTAAKVLIFQHGTTEPVSDARCEEILAHVKHVTEFFETEEYPTL